MPWYIKTEKFKKNILNPDTSHRLTVINKHRHWVESLSKAGIQIASGYLVNEKQLPGGGGLLILKANSYKEAQSIVEEDPMIAENLVDWKLQEWIYVAGNSIPLS